MFSTARVKVIGPWLWEMKYLWLALGVNFVALAIALRPHTSEPVIRLTGLGLQILGIGTVAWGISETRALFGHPSLVGKWRKWLARFPLLRKTLSWLSAAGRSSCQGAKFVATVQLAQVPTPPSNRESMFWRRT